MIAIVDTGLESFADIQDVLRRMDTETIVTRESKILKQADHIVLYGSTAYGDIMRAMAEHHLITAVKQEVIAGKPILGIGVGMQVLFSSSDENGFHRGLNILAGHISSFEDGIHQEGWSSVLFRHPHRLFRGLEEGDAYFSQSFYAQVTNYGDILAVNEQQTPVIVERGRIVGVQFYPEKSEEWGQHFLRQWVELYRVKV